MIGEGLRLDVRRACSCHNCPMDDLVAGLSIAAVGAVATVAAAYLTAAKERRDNRTNILRDLEIAAKLPATSEAHRALVYSIHIRALRIAGDAGTKSYTRGLWLGFLLAPFVAINLVLWVTDADVGGTWRLVALAAFCVVFAAIYHYLAADFLQRRQRNRFYDRVLDESTD